MKRGAKILVGLLIVVFGIPFLALSMLGTAMEFYLIPDSAVVEGDELHEFQLDYLREHVDFLRGEEILYFYSLGFFSIKSDGQFMTNRRVVSYGETETGEVEWYEAFYEEIADIEIDYGKGLLTDTEVTVTLKDSDSWLLMWLSVESGGDKEFCEAMLARWRAAQAETPSDGADVAEPPG